MFGFLSQILNPATAKPSDPPEVWSARQLAYRLPQTPPTDFFMLEEALKKKNQFETFWITEDKENVALRVTENAAMFWAVASCILGHPWRATFFDECQGLDPPHLMEKCSREPIEATEGNDETPTTPQTPQERQQAMLSNWLKATKPVAVSPTKGRKVKKKAVKANKKKKGVTISESGAKLAAKLQQSASEGKQARGSVKDGSSVSIASRDNASKSSNTTLSTMKTPTKSPARKKTRRSTQSPSESQSPTLGSMTTGSYTVSTESHPEGELIDIMDDDSTGSDYENIEESDNDMDEDDELSSMGSASRSSVDAMVEDTPESYADKVRVPPSKSRLTGEEKRARLQQVDMNGMPCEARYLDFNFSMHWSGTNKGITDAWVKLVLKVLSKALKTNKFQMRILPFSDDHYKDKKRWISNERQLREKIKDRATLRSYTDKDYQAFDYQLGNGRSGDRKARTRVLVGFERGVERDEVIRFLHEGFQAEMGNTSGVYDSDIQFGEQVLTGFIAYLPVEMNPRPYLKDLLKHFNNEVPLAMRVEWVRTPYDPKVKWNERQPGIRLWHIYCRAKDAKRVDAALSLLLNPRTPKKDRPWAALAVYCSDYKAVNSNKVSTPDSQLFKDKLMTLIAKARDFQNLTVVVYMENIQGMLKLAPTTKFGDCSLLKLLLAVKATPAQAAMADEKMEEDQETPELEEGSPDDGFTKVEKKKASRGKELQAALEEMTEGMTAAAVKAEQEKRVKIEQDNLNSVPSPLYLSILPAEMHGTYLGLVRLKYDNLGRSVIEGMVPFLRHHLQEHSDRDAEVAMRKWLSKEMIELAKDEIWCTETCGLKKRDIGSDPLDEGLDFLEFGRDILDSFQGELSIDLDMANAKDIDCGATVTGNLDDYNETRALLEETEQELEETEQTLRETKEQNLALQSNQIAMEQKNAELSTQNAELMQRVARMERLALQQQQFQQNQVDAQTQQEMGRIQGNGLVQQRHREFLLQQHSRDTVTLSVAAQRQISEGHQLIQKDQQEVRKRDLQTLQRTSQDQEKEMTQEEAQRQASAFLQAEQQRQESQRSDAALRLLSAVGDSSPESTLAQLQALLVSQDATQKARLGNQLADQAMRQALQITTHSQPQPLARQSPLTASKKLEEQPNPDHSPPKTLPTGPTDGTKKAAKQNEQPQPPVAHVLTPSHGSTPTSTKNNGPSSAVLSPPALNSVNNSNFAPYPPLLGTTTPTSAPPNGPGPVTPATAEAPRRATGSAEGP